MSTQDKGVITELAKEINPDIEVIYARSNTAYV